MAGGKAFWRSTATGGGGGGGVNDADSVDVNISETTTSTTPTNLATAGPAVTVDIGSSGMALVIVSHFSTNSSSTGQSRMEFAVSGANTRATSINDGAIVRGTQFETSTKQTLLTGLAAGSTTFTAKYYVSAGTGTFNLRRLSVIAL